MDSSSTNEVAHDFPPYFKVYKDGRIEWYTAVITVDARHDPSTGVQSKDVVISSETSVKARIFILKIDGPDRKQPVFVHYHGGVYVLSSTECDDDPKLNPEVDVNLKSMVGDRVLVCVAEKDLIRDRGLAYCDILLKSEWHGSGVL
ncbi:hypothetical protein EZV62_011353 [Acer yangbiense]|uniref:Alpha/beta hydrolase fold-3 domain-containing protein n=1 Tax=Acer yangbiense TaxID=1000413 RepID=A0A5C7I667_9ROSI|nr:hypothetical protein EZV62_011353 [Acer yangbiense]